MNSLVPRKLILSLPLLLIATAALASGQTIPIPDAAVGLSQGNMPILPGWHGTARVNRVSDPMGGALAEVEADLANADGSMSILRLPIAFHTISPKVPFKAPLTGERAEVAAYLQFQGTNDILTRYVLPKLNLGGEASAPFPVWQEAVPRIRRTMAQSNIPQPIADSAGILVVDRGRGMEVLVTGITVGGNGGQPTESTTTHITLYRAPLGQARGLEAKFERLPDVESDPAWTRADQDLYRRGIQKMVQDGERARAAIRAASQAQTANAQAGMAAQRSAFDAHNRAWADRQQALSDSHALSSGYFGDHSVSYDWCGPGGQKRTVTDSLNSPGAGYKRCN